MDRLDELIAALRSVPGAGNDTRFGAKHTQPTGTPTNIYAHGPGGLLTFPGVDPDVFSTIMLPESIASQIPNRASMYANPVFEALTGVLADSGSEPVNVCDDPPTAGVVKAGKVSAPYGRYSRETREFQLDRMGLYNDRADPTDLTLVNRPIVNNGILDSSMAQTDLTGVLRSELQKALFELGVSFNRLLSKQVWNGSSANNAAGGGYKEFNGLARLINTGYVDAETNTALPSLDSNVLNVNYARVDAASDTVIDALTYAMRYIGKNATEMNLDPVRWVIAMREELFYELTAVWPCNYLTYRCIVSNNGGERVNIDARDAVEMRDAMRRGKYLVIDGMQVQVITDPGITELTNTTSSSVTSGCFASDIYIVPMSVLGTRSVLFWEYFDFSNANIGEVLNLGRYAKDYWTTNGGAWLWHAKPPRNWCLQWVGLIEPRLIFRTPFLAARIKNVQYCPVQHTRTPYPEDPYFTNGGVTNRVAYAPSFYGD